MDGILAALAPLLAVVPLAVITAGYLRARLRPTDIQVHITGPSGEVRELKVSGLTNTEANREALTRIIGEFSNMNSSEVEISNEFKELLDRRREDMSALKTSPESLNGDSE